MNWKNWLQLLFGGPRHTPPPPPAVPVPPGPPAADDLLALHNAERAKAGLRPLLHDDRLAALALAHSKWMAAHDTLTHLGADGSPWDRLSAAGYAYRAAGENVGFNERTPAEAVAAWMSSVGHRANVLGGYTHFGGAVALGKSGPYWTAIFTTPA